MTHANGSFNRCACSNISSQPLLEVPSIVEPRERVGLRHVSQALVRLEQLAFALLAALPGAA